MIILKVTKKQGFTVSLYKTHFWKNHSWGWVVGGGQIHPLAFLGLSHWPEKFLQDERLSIKGYAAHSRYLDYRYLEQMPFIAIPYLG